MVHSIDILTSYLKHLSPLQGYFKQSCLCYLTGNIFGVEVSCGQCVDDVQTTCGQHVDDTRVRFRVRFHQQMTYVIWMSSAHCPHTCLSFLISCSTTPGVICMSSTHHLHVVCRHTCHLHIIHMSSAHHLHIICMSSAHTCHLHVICTSSADTYIICTVLMDPNCISCAKDTSY